MEAWDRGSHHWFQGIRRVQPDCSSLALCSKDGGKHVQLHPVSGPSTSELPWLQDSGSEELDTPFPFLYAQSSQVPEGGLGQIPTLSAPWDAW